MQNSKLLKKEICKGKKFTPISNNIFNLKLSGNGFLVLMFYISLPEGFNPSIRYTARKLNISPKTVINCNNELILLNIITLIRTGEVTIKKKTERVKGEKLKGFVTTYKFNNPSDWKQKDIKNKEMY